MSELNPGVAVDAIGVALDHEPVPPAQVVAGAPTTGTLVLDERDGLEIGVWEITEGTVTDVEADEVFIVLAGSATLAIEGLQPLELSAGSTVRLTAGMRTTWVVHETLRKLYAA